MTDHLTENARLRAALETMLHAVCGETGFASAVRLDTGLAYPWPALDDAEATARAALATPDPVTRKEVMPDDENSLPNARPDTSPGVTAGAPDPDAVQEAARVPEIAALIEAAQDLYETAIATTARATGGICGQTIECSMRSTMHSVSLFHLDVLNDALRAIAGDRTAKEAGQ